MTTSLCQPTGLVAAVDDRHVVLVEPRPGTVVTLTAGSQLAVRFRRPLGASRWEATAVPGHVLVLGASGHEFQLLVFGCAGATAPLRFERRRPDREIAHEVCELLVLPVSPVSGREFHRVPGETHASRTKLREGSSSFTGYPVKLVER